MPIKKLLIANRGEIACRIMRTAQKMGIATVAIYSQGEENALHVQMADESYNLGALPLENTYLNGEKIITIAQSAQVDAIHPGYGFLSENAEFAKACEQAGVIFVGPSSQAITAMASKDEAKITMAQADVPTIPGYMGKAQDENTLANEAKLIGYPVLLKAAKGGGGKGMRLVHAHEEVAAAIQAAKRESLNSFGDDTLIIEKYLPQARHIEVQVIRDGFGNTRHLFERDCSIQRRHQKIIEFTPALNIPEKIKAALYEAAMRAAEAIDYRNAGTIEFLFHDNAFYFMEMNTRLQVEHPITEMVTGVDLVEWQLRIANGEAIPLAQSEIQQKGSSIEARVYAEDPFNQFFPVSGQITKLNYPNNKSTRIDSGVNVGSEISVHFDPLIAKIIVHGPSFSEATKSMQQVLDQTLIFGVTTNLPFLRKIIKNPDFIAGKMHTQYVEQNLKQLLPHYPELNAQILTTACQLRLAKRAETATSTSPWQQMNCWRLNLPFHEILTFNYHGQNIEVTVNHLDETHSSSQRMRGSSLDSPFRKNDDEFILICPEYGLNQKVELIETKLFPFYIDENSLTFLQAGYEYAFSFAKKSHDAGATDENHLIAPMPGIITQVWVKNGDKVNKGEKLLALEAMKMEHTVLAPQHGIVKNVFYRKGEQVKEGSELVEIEFAT